MVIVGLPAYNEEAALPRLFGRLQELRQKLGGELKVVAVNDGSEDETGRILEDMAKTCPYLVYLKHEKNKGLGNAVKTLLEYVCNNSFADEDIFVLMDADNTHNPDIIPSMTKKLKEENHDLVIASRFAKGGKEIGVSLARKLISRGAMVFFKIFFPIKNINDYSCGFRAYNIGYLKEAAKIYGGNLVTANGFECMAEILVKLRKIGVKAAECPLVLEYNLKKGKSKIKIFKTVWGYLKLLGLKTPGKNKTEVSKGIVGRNI